MKPYIIPVRDADLPAFTSASEALERLVESKLGRHAAADLELREDDQGRLIKVFPQGATRAVAAGKLVGVLSGILFASLKDGSLSAYVEASATGKHYRLPRYYWTNAAPSRLDEGMAPYPEAAGYQDSMEGMPVLLDRGEVEEWGQRLAIKDERGPASPDAELEASPPQVRLSDADLLREVRELHARDLSQTATYEEMVKKYPSVVGLRRRCRDAWNDLATAAGQSIRPGPQPLK